MSKTHDPIVWRKICVPSSINFDQLHMAIQLAFGWRNAHLYQFSENGFQDLLRIASPYDEECPIGAEQISIEKTMFELLNINLMSDKELKSLKYIYDYGDSWEHDIVVEKFIRELKPMFTVLAGEGACPPEDCGGIGGFNALKNELRTGEVDEHYGDSFKPWLNGVGYKDYDPEHFDLIATQKNLEKYIQKNKNYFKLMK